MLLFHNNKTITAGIFFILFSLVSVYTYAQCCGGGGSCCMPGNNNLGVLDEGKLQTITTFKHSFSDNYLKGDGRYDQSNNQLKLLTSLTDYTGININYGVTHSFTMEVDLGYYVRKQQNFLLQFSENNTTFSQKYLASGTGLGDLTLLPKFRFFKSKDSVFSMIICPGAKIPTGPWKQYSADGVLLSRDIQSGTGAFAGIFALYTITKLKNDQLVFINSRFEYNAQNKDKYSYGSTLVNSISTTFKLYKKKIYLFSMIRNDNKWHDVDHLMAQGQQWQQSSGYRKVNVVAGFIFKLPKKFDVGFYYDQPVYQYFNGQQYANKYFISCNIIKLFTIGKEHHH